MALWGLFFSHFPSLEIPFMAKNPQNQELTYVRRKYFWKTQKAPILSLHRMTPFQLSFLQLDQVVTFPEPFLSTWNRPLSTQVSQLSKIYWILATVFLEQQWDIYWNTLKLGWPFSNFHHCSSLTKAVKSIHRFYSHPLSITCSQNVSEYD